MKHGIQTQLAKLVGVTPQTLHDYMTGRSGASPVIAKRIGHVINHDPFAWMRGGNVASRRPAVEAWGDRQ